MRRIVLQAIAGTCPALELTAPFARQYAESVGAEYVQERFPNAPVHDAFAKLTLDEWCMRADQTLWLDADVLCRPGAPDVFATAPMGAITAFATEGSLHQQERARNNWPLFAHGYFNSGVMVWPKDAAGLMREAMEIRRRGELDGINKSRWFFEQTALNMAVEKSGIRVANLDYRFNGYLADAEICDRWPDHPELHPLSECWFVHFAGGAHTRQGYPFLRGDRHSQTLRAELMQRWIADNYGEDYGNC